ncbi:hypothetical protein TruAng_005121 [Truncatella angustata]|nr:hypothetical protein TruAng_005121 [Truncatella angustata]
MTQGMDSEGSSDKPPKPRNTEARKEQNRIASRAYTLLDQILKTDDVADSSPSSPSDAGDCALSVMCSSSSSRDSSGSPLPAPEALPVSDATAPLWPPNIADGMSDLTNHYGGVVSDSLDNLWMGALGQDGYVFDAHHGLVDIYHPANVPLLESQLHPGLTPLISSYPPPEDTLLEEHYGVSHVAESQGTHDTRHDAPYSYSEVGVHPAQDSAVDAVLNSFSQLDESQQRRVLKIIHRKRGRTGPVPLAWDMTLSYPVTPPPGM